MMRSWAIALDAAVFIAFAVVGQDTPGGSRDIGTLAAITLPFLIGWFGAALGLGLYRDPLSWSTAGITFVAGMAIAFGLRVLLFGRGIPPTF